MIGILHMTLAVNVSDSQGFGTWINKTKDLSRSALAQHIDKDTALMLGSSELHHGNRSPYHPTQVFRRLDMDVMCVGAAYNQSLSHAIAVGSVSENMEHNKVLLIVSPAWFDDVGVKKEAFAMRFSETEYIGMLKNPKLSPVLKQDIAKRTLGLLAADHSTTETLQRYNDCYLNDTLSPVDRPYIFLREQFLTEKERLRVNTLWKLKGKEKYVKFKENIHKKHPNWATMKEKADKSYYKHATNNEFGIVNSLYNKKFAPLKRTEKDTMTKRQYLKSSPEYGDLDLFLRVCKESDLDVMLVLLPVNGKWYDYLGFKQQARSVLPAQVKAVADRYDVQWYSFFDQDYTAGFLEDVFHPAGKGWTAINEKAYSFFTSTATKDTSENLQGATPA